MNEASSKDNKYAKSKTERQKHVETILNSKSNKKIVVAGPGTGKTFLFKELLKDKNNSLTLTFINSLVEDLSLELYGLSDVKTLHGFALNLLSKNNQDVEIYPKLPDIIREDAKILLNADVDFNEIFHNLNSEEELINFYKKRKDYYGKYYGYTDIIYAILKLCENKKDKVPIYEQVVVDEFQDFNKLEVALIDLISEKNPILLAGDDDQALYDFKSASPDHIRNRYGKNKEYTSFTLPYCSRCTKVIVEAVNDIIISAVKEGNFPDRVDKEYKYFNEEDKDRVCSLHPHIAYAQKYKNQLVPFIEKSISKIAECEKKSFSVLIISPIRTQIRDIACALKDKGFENVHYVAKKDDEEPTFLEGLKILSEKEGCNLGWRIICKKILNSEEFEIILKNTNANKEQNICELINSEKKKEVKKILKIFKAIQNDKDVDNQDLIELLDKANINPYEMAKEYLKEDFLFSARRFGNHGIRKIPINTTTIQSSKGLSADYVFITYFDDQYFIKNNTRITDKEICNFLVAITRAKKKVFLISSAEKEPTFLKWINTARIEKIK